MATLKLTAKRQATFPLTTCKSLGVRPGDTIDLEACVIGGEKVWVLRPRAEKKREWIGCLKGRIKKVKDHSMDAVRESIIAGRLKELES